MPLNVTLAINDKPIQRIVISRLAKLKAKDAWYPYRVQSEAVVRETAFFNHRYSDGAEECVRRALDALATSREREEHDDVPES